MAGPRNDRSGNADAYLAGRREMNRTTTRHVKPAAWRQWRWPRLAGTAAFIALFVPCSAFAQSPTAGERLKQAELNAALVSHDYLTRGAKIEDIFPRALATFNELQGLDGPENEDAIGLSYFIMLGLLQKERYQEAERLGLWRLQVIPRLQSKLRKDGVEREARDMILDALTEPWFANLLLARAYGGQEKWQAALPYHQKALDLYLAKPGSKPTDEWALTARSQLADVLARTRSASLAHEALFQRLEELRLRIQAGQSCSDEVFDTVHRLDEVPSVPDLDAQREEAVRSAAARCPGFKERLLHQN
jgi:hypothetical protein